MNFICEQVLLEHGSQIEYKNNYGQAALSRAAQYGSADVVKVRFILLSFVHNDVVR